MKKQFVTYEIALKLKELGFDEECQRWTNPEKQVDAYEIGFVKNSEEWLKFEDCALPLWQQVIDWFREKHDYNIELRRNWPKLKYFYTIDHPVLREVSKATYSYTEAREQAILKAIELCQKN